MEQGNGLLRLLYTTSERRKMVLSWEAEDFTITGNDRLFFTVDATQYKGLITVSAIRMDQYSILFHETGKFLESVSGEMVVKEIHRIVAGC